MCDGTKDVIITLATCPCAAVSDPLLSLAESPSSAPLLFLCACVPISCLSLLPFCLASLSILPSLAFSPAHYVLLSCYYHQRPPLQSRKGPSDLEWAVHRYSLSRQCGDLRTGRGGSPASAAPRPPGGGRALPAPAPRLRSRFGPQRMTSGARRFLYREFVWWYVQSIFIGSQEQLLGARIPETAPHRYGSGPAARSPPPAPRRRRGGSRPTRVPVRTMAIKP